MSSKKILSVCQEVFPYVGEHPNSEQCRTFLQGMSEMGYQIRTFMPRWGMINERRNQLHEVIRLSGMNLIINDNDHQLILKVATIPTARLQVYFIDNEDYFSRKAQFAGEDGVEFADNDERAIFFSRGVLETVKKLRWDPDILHIHGWFSTMAPIYLKHVFNDDPIFKETKIVISIYDDTFKEPLNSDFAKKIAHEGVTDDELSILDEPTYQNLYRYVLKYADGVVIASQGVDPQVREYAEKNAKKFFDYQDPQSADYLKNYNDFYESL